MKNEFELYSPCHFGLESVLKREILDLGYEITEVVDGRVSFKGDEAAIARANIFLRTTERVMIQIGSFKAVTFEELFQGIKSLPWEKYIPKNGKFWVKKAASIKSKLFSPSDIQKIVKKAMVARLSEKYNLSWFPEDGASYPLRITILKDVVTVGIDTSGESLHKRGYRKMTAKAPLTETLAAALISLTPWKKDRILIDPFCGSGTIPIEAALMGLNIAPGLKRDFEAMTWTNIIKESFFQQAREEALDLVDRETKLSIQGYDIDGAVLEAARHNARLAGVEEQIHFQRRDISKLASPKKYGFVITNPPYGERLEEKETIPELYRIMGESLKNLENWSYYIISGYQDAEACIGRKADKNRKIYNGMMKTYFYSYPGPKPPKKEW